MLEPKIKRTSSIIECNCFLYRKDLYDLGVPTEDIAARHAFDISEVSTIRERTADNDDNDAEICDKTCLVTFKTGESSVIDISYEKMLNYLKANER